MTAGASPAARNYLLRGRAAVARQAHNLKVAGSIPAPATKFGVAQLAEHWRYGRFDHLFGPEVVVEVGKAR